jgi:hypothetical protein
MVVGVGVVTRLAVLVVCHGQKLRGQDGQEGQGQSGRVERNKGTILHPGLVERWNRKMSTTTTNGDIQS